MGKVARLGRAGVLGELHAELAAARQLIVVAEQRLGAVAGGVDHPRIDTAYSRLPASAAAVVSAAQIVSPFATILLSMVMVGIRTWAAATVAGSVLGLSAGSTIAVTVVVLAVTVWPNHRLEMWVVLAVTRRRLVSAGTSLALPPVAGDPLDGALDLLSMAQQHLATAANRQISHHRLTRVVGHPAGMSWTRVWFPTISQISLADQMLCQAIDSIETWQATTTRTPHE